MSNIDVQITSAPDGWVADVTVAEGGASTKHRVTMSADAYERLTAGRRRPEECIRASFEFLLEREPKEAVLREFDLPVIGRYFPEYEAELQRRLAVG